MTNRESKLIQEPSHGGLTTRKMVVRRDLFIWRQKNEYTPGEEFADRWYHVQTPDKQRCGEMYTYVLEGYAYGSARPLLATWVGYLYADAVDLANVIVNGNAVVSIPLDIGQVTATQYIGANGHLYLCIGPLKQYYTSFSLTYRSGTTGEVTDNGGKHVHLPENYSVTVKNNDHPI